MFWTRVAVASSTNRPSFIAKCPQSTRCQRRTENISLWGTWTTLSLIRPRVQYQKSRLIELSQLCLWYCTETANKDGTWLGEMSSCCCLTTAGRNRLTGSCCLTKFTFLFCHLCTFLANAASPRRSRLAPCKQCSIREIDKSNVCC